MRKRSAFVPSALDRLESRLALNAGLIPPPQDGPVAATPVQTHTITLQGMVEGFELPNPLVSANPGGLLLLGRGKVAPLGQVDLVGTLSSRSAEPTTYDGTVMLFNSLGGINVHIFGIVGGPSGPPAHLHYDILEGFGAFQGATGNGNVVYVQNPPMNDRTPFLLTFS